LTNNYLKLMLQFILLSLKKIVSMAIKIKILLFFIKEANKMKLVNQFCATNIEQLFFQPNFYFKT
jgi:hypothetical protein